MSLDVRRCSTPILVEIAMSHKRGKSLRNFSDWEIATVAYRLLVQADEMDVIGTAIEEVLEELRRRGFQATPTFRPNENGQLRATAVEERLFSTQARAVLEQWLKDDETKGRDG